MQFNSHFHLAGKHARLTASRPHWLKYDEDKLDRVFFAMEEAERGTKLHEYAAMAIRLGQKQPNSRTTMSMYINDAI